MDKLIKELDEIKLRMKAFFDPDGNPPEDTGEFRELKGAIKMIEVVIRSIDDINSRAKSSAPIEGDVVRPKIVCLCGSTRFKEQYEQAERDFTLKGYIVLTVGLFGHVEGLDMSGKVKTDLDQLHLRKINMADEVYIINVGNYIGASTLREIGYAEVIGKPVTYLEHRPDNASK